MTDTPPHPDQLEHRRRHFLTLLDIDPLESRFDAPFGRASSRFSASLGAVTGALEKPVSDADAGRASASDTHALANQEGNSVLQQMKVAGHNAKASSVSGAGVAPQSDIPAEELPPQDLAPKDLSREVAFHLLLVSAGEWLWIESLREGLLHKEQLSLIHNMAIAVSAAPVDLEQRQFIWPMADHPHLPRDEVAARQSVTAQLERIANDNPYRGVIALGEPVREWIIDARVAEQICIPSTFDMLEQPLLKREAWNRLKHLADTSLSNA
jgi:hypothetical protein